MEGSRLPLPGSDISEGGDVRGDMAVDFAVGDIPPYYREVYDSVCPNQEHVVDRDAFSVVFSKTSLPQSILTQIWDACESAKQGGLSRGGLYKALALVAVAQQGKAVSDKSLDVYADQELPRPALGELSDVAAQLLKLRRRCRSPGVFGYSFEELSDMDSVQVELLPEKKGIILKHVEYDVSSLRYRGVKVKRRYSDFVALQELLLLRFPYRMLPSLPPKQFGNNGKDFIEARRKALKRYLNFLARHPVVANDKLGILQYFFTFSGQECQHKIREQFRAVPDEFMTFECSVKPKELVPMDTQAQYTTSRTHVTVLLSSTTRLRDVAERMAQRSLDTAVDLSTIATELSNLSADGTPVTKWASGASSTWQHLKKGLKSSCSDYAALSERAAKQSASQELLVTDQLDSLLDVLTSYKELCERHQKGVLNDHQRAVARMGTMKKKQMSATVRGGGSEESQAVEQQHLEQRILEQENAIANMENRNYFSLHCIQMETQLVHVYLKLLWNALQSMASVEAQGSLEVSELWAKVKPSLDKMLPPAENGTCSPRLLTASPSSVSSAAASAGSKVPFTF